MHQGKQQNFNQVSFLRIWLADNELHSLIRTRLATNYNIIRVITLCSLLYVPGDARIQVETNRNCSEIQPHCFSTIREWIWRKSQMADRPQKKHSQAIAAFQKDHLKSHNLNFAPRAGRSSRWSSRPPRPWHRCVSVPRNLRRRPSTCPGHFPRWRRSGSPWVGYTNDRTRSPWSRNGDPHIPKCHLPSTEWKFEWEQSNVRQKVANCPILHSQRLPCLQFDKISDQDFDAQ